METIVREESNVIACFPKLPTMMKTYYKNKEKIREKDTAEHALVPDVNILPCDFFAREYLKK